MLEVNSVTKKFGNKIAVNNISFKAKEGKIFGLLGRNGAGKSTIFRMILNIIEEDKGSILYNNEKITSKTMDRIGYLPEECSLILNYTVLEQLLYYGSLKSLSETEIRERAIWLLKRFNIFEYMNMKIKDLSKGNRQKIQFIIAILHNPDIIILDEPFSGLDPISVNELKNFVLELKKEDKIIIFSSHRMDHTEMLCEDILIIDKGNNIVCGNLEEIKNNYDTKIICVKGDLTDNDLNNIRNLDFIKSVKNFNDLYKFEVIKEKYNTSLISYFRNDSNIKEFYTEKVDLEKIFLEKVGDISE